MRAAAVAAGLCRQPPRADGGGGGGRVWGVWRRAVGDGGGGRGFRPALSRGPAEASPVDSFPAKLHPIRETFRRHVMTACIVGWAHGQFGKRQGEDIEKMLVEVCTRAIADAGVAPADIDEISVGHFGGGFAKQDFPASLVLQASDALRFKPATRVENACATGSAAIHQGVNSIAAQETRVGLVAGVEKMTETPGDPGGGILMKCSYGKQEARPA